MLNFVKRSEEFCPKSRFSPSSVHIATRSQLEPSTCTNVLKARVAKFNIVSSPSRM